MSATITTADGRTVGEGARVFDFYDGKWGVVGRIDVDGWFVLLLSDGARGGYLNGERVCVRIPADNPFYATHGGTDGYGAEHDNATPVLTCDYGPKGENATRVTDSGDVLCDAHAREHYGTHDWRTETRKLTSVTLARVLAARA